MNRIFLGFALALATWGFCPALRAQSTHLTVPPKQITKIVFNQIYDPSAGTVTTYWAEWIDGAYTAASGKAFEVPKDRTLIITDLDATIRCNAAVTNPPSITLFVNILDPGGNPIQILNRMIPARTTVGYEQQRITVLGGHVVPPAFQLQIDPVDPTALPTHWIRRIALHGYYTF
jgi:hypothetical protein